MSTTFYRGENPLHADKLNTAFSERVSRGGDTMQGFLTLAADPVQPFDAATKQYVDRFTAMGVPTGAYIGASPPGNTLAPLWWDNVSGQLFIQYNDGNSTQWVSANSAVTTGGMSGLFLPLTGGALTGPLTSNSSIAAGTTLGSAARPGFLMFNSYIGDNAHPWFTGGNWGFGWRPATLTDAAKRPLSVQRDAVYSGTLVGANPGALQVTTNVSAGVTGLESALIATINNNATDGLYVAGTFNVVKNVAGSGTIAVNIVAGDQSTRKSSISGGNVAAEIDTHASGPDDIGIRINTEMTFRSDSVSPDGDSTFLYGAVRCRGAAVIATQGIGVTLPATATHAFGATTINEGLATGLQGAFITPFWADGCSGAAYSAVSAVQQLATSAAFSTGVTTITLTNPLLTASYVWVGALVTGTNIPAGTHVVSSSYNTTTQITTVVFDRTIGALTSGQVLTFTNAIGTGFQAGGYLTTAAFASPGFNVSPTGAVTVQNEQTIGWPTNYLQYRAATSRLYYVVGGVDMWSIDASGNMRCAGTITGSTTP